MGLGNADVAEMEPKAVEGLTLQRKIPPSETKPTANRAQSQNRMHKSQDFAKCGRM